MTQTYAPVTEGPGHGALCDSADPHPRHRHGNGLYNVCSGIPDRFRTPEHLDACSEGQRATGDNGIVRIKGPYGLWYQLDADGERSGVGVPSYVVWAAPAPAPTAEEVAAKAVARFFHTSMGGSEEDAPTPTEGDAAIAADVVIALRDAGHLKAAPNT